jgi:hypothetical protein
MGNQDTDQVCQQPDAEIPECDTEVPPNMGVPEVTEAKSEAMAISSLDDQYDRPTYAGPEAMCSEDPVPAATAAVEEIHGLGQPSSPITLPDPAPTSDAGGTAHQDLLTPKPDLVPRGSNGGIYINKKQTPDTEVTGTDTNVVCNSGSTSRRQQVATVRSEFLKLFPEARDNNDDWKFFGWVTKEYGVDICLGKIKYMREHRRHHTICNPKGFLRMALVRDYQIPASIAAKIHGDERAKLAIERSRRESEEWRRHVASFDYDAAQAACQKILDMLSN